MNRIVGSIVLAVLAGCSAPREPLSVTSADPSAKIPAIKIAVQEKDKPAAQQLVKDLESDDPAIRFYAIEGLRKLTGESFGYRYYDDEAQRQPAVERWQAWLKQVDGEYTAPAHSAR